MIPQHAPHNAMTDPGEIARFRDRCSPLMGELLDRVSASGRWEIFMDRDQAAALHD